MINEQPAPSFLQNGLRICRQALSVLLILLGLCLMYAMWGAFHCGGSFDFTLVNYAPVFFSLSIITVGVSLWFWEESPRPLGAAVLMLPLSVIFGVVLGEYRCGEAVGLAGFTTFTGAILTLICVGIDLLLLVWKRPPILRPAAESAYTTRAFNAVSRFMQFRGAGVIAGAAAVIAILYFAQPADTSLKSASAPSEHMAQITPSSVQAAWAGLAAHAGEPGAAGVAFDAIKVEKALGPCSQAAKSPEAMPLDEYHYARVLDANKSYADAAVWYLKAANQGVAFAQYGLGVLYTNGEGVPKSDAIAIQWYRKAADQNNPDALANLGAFEWDARGGLQDKAKAMEHTRRAAALGSDTAKKNLQMWADDKAADDQADAYAKSLGRFGEFLRAVQKNHERNGYYDKDASGQSNYHRDAAEVARDNAAQERQQNERKRQSDRYGESMCAASGKHYDGFAGCF